MQEQPEGQPAAVVTRGLTVAYGRAVAIDGADLVLPAGALSALIGPNGAGKSTLLHAIAGLVPAAAGTVTVLGQAPGADAANVGYVLQTAQANTAMPVTVREVVAMGRYARTGPFGRFGAGDHAAVDIALERLAIADLANRQLHELSGGQRQRVLVAQGFAQEADLLLLDEPVTGVDVVSRERILAAIADEVAAGRTVVMSTHDLSEAAAADHLVLLARRVVAAGPPADVLTEGHLLAAYGSRVLRLDGGRLLLDDGAHHPH